MIHMAPSILSADFSRLGEEVKAVADAGADMIHLDVMDGHFVPNLTLGPPVIKSIRKVTDLPMDAHLMIANAELYLEDYARAGADYITLHAEACTHLHRALGRIAELGVKPAVTLNPATPLAAISEVLPMVDMILIMSVNPGFGGQSFIEASLDKIARLRAMLDERGLDPLIQVDGGISKDTIGPCVKAGANVFVSGSSIFGHPQGYKFAMEEMRTAAEAS